MAFDELSGSPTIGGGTTGMHARRTGKILWSEIGTVFSALFPPSVLGIPQLPQLYPGSSILYAKNVEFEPFHPDDVPDCGSTPPTYDYAKCTIEYETLDYEQSDPDVDQIITRRFAVGAEFITMPNHGIRWHGDTKPIPDTEFDAGKLIPTHEIIITLHRVTAAYYATLRALTNTIIGCVNDDTFEGAPAETLLFQGAEFQETVTTAETTWQVDLRFSMKIVKSGTQTVGWNYAFDPVSGTWKRFETMNGDAIYPTDDFDQFY